MFSWVDFNHRTVGQNETKTRHASFPHILNFAADSFSAL